MLTDRQIRGLKPRSRGEYSLSDGAGGRRGLYIVVKPNGRKVWRGRLTVDGKTGYRDLGDYPGLTLAGARDAFDEYRRERRQRAVQRKQHEAPETTVKELLAEWNRVYLQKHRKRPEQATSAIERDVIPVLGDVLLVDVERRDLVLVLDAVLERGARKKNTRAKTDGRRMADTLRALLIQMFAFGVERGLLEDSPARLLAKPLRGRHAETRDRVLDDEELRRLWFGLATAPKESLPEKYRPRRLSRMTPAMKRLLKLLLLTGLRRSEAALAEWSEIDWKASTWTIPADRAKTARPLVMPLSELAVEILKEQHQLTVGKRFVFASPRTDFKRPLLPSAVSQAINDNCKRLEIKKFTPHDLRRTFRSRLAGLGVDAVVAKKLMNHALDGMDKVYDRHDYLDEMSDAVEQWAVELRRIVAEKPRKIVPMPDRDKGRPMGRRQAGRG